MSIDDAVDSDDVKVNIRQAFEIMGGIPSESTLRKLANHYRLGMSGQKVRSKAEKYFGVRDLIKAIERAMKGDGMNVTPSTVESLKNGKANLEAYLKNGGSIEMSDVLDVDGLLDSLPRPAEPWDPDDDDSLYSVKMFMKMSNNVLDSISARMLYEMDGDVLSKADVRLSPGEILRRIEKRITQEGTWTSGMINDMVIPYLYLAGKLPGRDTRAYAKQNPARFENMVAEINHRNGDDKRSDENIYSLDDILTYGEVSRAIGRKISDVTLPRLMSDYCTMDPIDIYVQNKSRNTVKGFLLEEYIKALGMASVDGRRNITDRRRQKYFNAAMKLANSASDGERIGLALMKAYEKFTARAV